MSTKLSSIGWAINLTRCEHLDPDPKTAEVYAVNIVMPRADEKNPDWFTGLTDERGPIYSGKDAWTDFGDFLVPWKWTNLSWFAYGGNPVTNTNDISWTQLAQSFAAASGVSDLNSYDSGKVQRGMEKEYRERTNDANYAFSLAADDLGEPYKVGSESNSKTVVRGQSLVHAITPATHLPASVSNGILGLAGFISIPKDLLDGYQFVAAFPQFSIETDARIAPARNYDSEVSSPQDSSHVSAGYAAFPNSDTKVVFISQPVKRTALQLAQTSSNSSFIAEDMMMGLAARHFAPMQILARALTKVSVDNIESIFGFAGFDPKTYADFRLKLWESLSVGRLPNYIGAKDILRSPHVLDFIAPPSLVEEFFVKPFPEKPKQLIDAKICTFFLEWALALAEGRLRAALSILAKNPDLPKDPAKPTDEEKRRNLQGFSEWLGAWRDVADAANRTGSLKEFYPIFWRLSLRQHANNNPDDAKWKVLMDKIEPLLGPDIQERVILGIVDQIDASPAPHTSPLSPVKMLRTVPSDEQQLKQWVSKDLADIQEAVTANAGFALGGLPKNLRDASKELFDSFRKLLYDQLNRPTHVGKDVGVEIMLDAGTRGQGGADYDQHIRGFAVALMSGLVSSDTANPDPLWDSGRASWLTHTAVSYSPSPPPPNGELPLVRLDSLAVPDSQPIAWMALTLGSSSSAGKRMVSTNYEGKPLCSILMTDSKGTLVGPDSDLDQTDLLDYRWPLYRPPEGRLPLLGYGMTYLAATTAIDNAGGVIGREWQKNRTFAELADNPFRTPAQIGVGRNLGQYLSREAPGAPVLKNPLPTEGLELSSETKAHAFLSAKRETDAVVKVALLVHDQQIGGKPLFAPAKERFRKYEIEICPPGTHPDFIARWLATDGLILEKYPAPGDAGIRNELLSDPSFSQLDLATFEEFRTLVLGAVTKAGQNEADQIRYHPAVSAIGIAVWFDGSDVSKDPNESKVVTFDRVTKNKNAKLVPNQFKHPFTVEFAANGKNTLTDTTLSLKKGSFARLCFYSLVEKRFSDASKPALCRYEPGLTSNALKFTDTVGNAYLAFGPQEHWFEVAPEWDIKDYPNTLIDLRLAPPDQKNPNLAVLFADGDPSITANWLKGVDVRRNEWHWTGYPVDLPGRGADLGRWLSAFPGVESYRESFDRVFQTKYEISTGSWKLGFPTPNGTQKGWSDLIHTLNLPSGIRPSRYTAYVAKPIVRFRRWLNVIPNDTQGPRSIENKVFACGELLSGIARPPGNERLPSLALLPPVPLTATYVEGPEGRLPRRISNGNMLVMMEPLRRTDPATRIGGLGDTLELDLLQTKRITRKDGQGQEVEQIPSLVEIGPNPIFHPAPDQTYKVPSLTLGRYFGLTDDQVRNAMVGQTAVVVHPPENSQEWLMAKARVRRIILPETLLGGPLLSLPNVFGHAQWELPQRKVGSELVPIDFCIDLGKASQWPKQVKLEINSIELVLKLPPEIDAGERRLLCSWHRERWQGGGDATWRVQILAQLNRGDSLEWETKAKRSCYDQQDWNPLHGGTKILLIGEGSSGLTCQRVMLSDYTEPFWMTFIGTFGGTSFQRADQYALREEASVNPAFPKTYILEPGNLGPLAPPPIDAAGWNTANPEFHLILVFKPVTAISQGEPDTTAGELVGVLKPVSYGNDSRFEKLDTKSPDFDPKGCYTYLCAFQRITAPADSERVPIDSWVKLIQAMFPDQTAGIKESTVRALPKYLGPIKMVSQ